MEPPSHPFLALPEKKQIYQGKRFSVYTAMIEGKKGKQVEKEAVIHPGAVVILPLYDQDHLIMIKNERIVVGKTLWELPAGTLESNEEPPATAKRELIEETGYEANEMTFLSAFYTSPGFCDEKMFAFLAKDLTLVGQKLEETEKIEVEIVSWTQVWDWAKKGLIIDGKTLSTLLLYKLQTSSN